MRVQSIAWGISILRVGVLVPFSIVALHEVDAALAGSDLSSRIRAAAIIVFLPMLVLGTLAITYILRRWLLLRAGLSVQLARWYAARTDMWLSPMALAIPLAFQSIFGFPAVVSFWQVFCSQKSQSDRSRMNGHLTFCRS